MPSSADASLRKTRPRSLGQMLSPQAEQGNEVIAFVVVEAVELANVIAETRQLASRAQRQ